MKRVVVLEDDVDTCELVKQQLTSKGYEVNCFTSIEGYEKYQQIMNDNNPDVVLCDILYPIDGRMLCRYSKNLKNFSDVPVVLMSGNGIAVQELDECGAAGFLPKPFNGNLLEQVLARYAA